MKNHYIPQFYLKRWAKEKQLIEFSRPRPGYQTVIPKRKTPAATGYKEGIYDFKGIENELKSILETIFFLKIDSGASQALDAMIENNEINEKNRFSWCTFLISLISRHPEDIEAFKSVYIRDFRKVSQEDRDAYARARIASYPLTVEEFYSTIGQNFLENMALKNIPYLMQHKRAVCELMGMHWLAAKPPQDGYFLTSDRPVVRNFLGKHDSHWILPIGPKAAFLAVNNIEYGLYICDEISRQLWKALNRTVVRQAVGLGFSDDEKHLPFFQKHLAAERRPSVFWSFVADPFAAPPLQRVP